MDEDEDVRTALKGPALGLLVSGVLGILACLADAAFNAYSLAESSFLPPWVHSLAIAMDLALIGAYGFVVVTAQRLRELRCSWGAATAAAVIAMLPCQSCCCVSLGFGIWAMIVLIRPEVKEAFAARAA